MLKIKDIKKTYVTGDLVQTALDGVSLNLRDNEFVAILGPSGSGKTTLLNVIGGLDRYDSGDLIINGISTRKYTDRDWDSYRNHTIGFVFQSYNLIPHQSVLANVELALTISGISRRERRKRAAAALEAVGLGNQLHKRPNQMSGGQMQRVAIARALVNDPDILLADEPTGALDSETSVQVMDLLKEVSRDRLVVMVTHNPELAESYANRIVRVKDGRITGDTNPLEDTAEEAPAQHKNMGKAAMSFFTALSLSFNNLLTKKARTLLTAFAGSIGIIGIALIMSLSTGFQKYIDKIQADTLSNYPLTIQTETSDMASMMSAFGTSLQAASQAEEGTVVEQQMISQMFGQVGKNDLASFKAYLEEHYGEISHTITSVQYSYNLSPRIFCEDMRYGVIQANPGTLFDKIMGNSMMSAFMNTNVFFEMMDDREMLEDQYEVVRGRWPEGYNELVVVLTDPSQITDYMSYTLGLKDPAELDELMRKVMSGQEADPVADYSQWTYDDLMGLKFRLVNAAQLYRYNSEYAVWEDMSDDEAYLRDQIAQGELLEVVGIVCPREGANATAMTAGVAYTRDLTEHVISLAEGETIVQNQLENRDINVFTGAPFNEKPQTELNFEDMISIDQQAISSSFGMNLSAEGIMNLLKNFLNNSLGSMNIDTTAAQGDFKATFSQLGTEMLQQFVASGDGKLYLTDAGQIVEGYLATESAQGAIQALAGKYGVPADTFTGVYESLLTGLIGDIVADNLAPGQPEPPEETEPTDPTGTEPPVTDPPVTEPPITEPPVTEPPVTEPPVTEPPAEDPESAPEVTEAPATHSMTVSEDMIYAILTADQIPGAVESYCGSALVNGTASMVGIQMMRPALETMLRGKLSEFGGQLAGYIGGSFYVNAEKLASAFQFNMTEEDLSRLMSAMSGQGNEQTAQSNLRSLGYADLREPVMISIYLRDFEAKEEFMDFLDGYNDQMTQLGQEDQVIRYTDVTGIMMSSVRTIIDSVSYALIAFVAVSLVVSSIMIGIITYISVMERTKEIGVLRAIGASKRNISQVFNAETFIIGLCSGLMGIGVTLLILIPANALLLHLTNNPDIVAQLPMTSAGALVILSVILTLIGGFIPAKKAAKKDPVIALRSE